MPDLSVLKNIPWWGWVIAVGGAGTLVFLVVRRQRSGGGGAATSGGQQGQQLPSNIDPLTGVPYTIESAIDPKTGLPVYYSQGTTPGPAPIPPPGPTPGPTGPPNPKPTRVPGPVQTRPGRPAPDRGGPPQARPPAAAAGSSAPSSGSVVVRPWPAQGATLHAIWQQHGAGMSWPTWRAAVIGHPANRGMGGSDADWLYPWQRVYLP